MVNKLTITFQKEKEVMILEKILLYMSSFDFKYTYIVFGYNDWNFDLSCYYDDYEKLKSSDYGIIRLKEKDRLNTQFIYELLNNYQTCSMYITNNVTLAKNLDFLEWKKNDMIPEGFAINDMLFDYMIIEKSDYLPDWKLLKNIIEKIKKG